MSLLCFVNSLVLREHLHFALVSGEHLECVTIFEVEIVNNKAFKHANLSFTKPWALTSKILLNIMQNLKSDFLKHEF